jgi:hypothetical protein
MFPVCTVFRCIKHIWFIRYPCKVIAKPLVPGNAEKIIKATLTEDEVEM